MEQEPQQSFFIGETCFCIPKSTVTAVISAQDILPLATVPDYVLGTFSYQDQRLVAISVAMQMGLTQADYHRDHMIIVVEQGEVALGLLVDRIGDDFVQPHWEVLPYHSELFTNASVHSNEVVIQLELDNLLTRLDLHLAEGRERLQAETFNRIQISGYSFVVPQSQISFITEPGSMTRIPMMPPYALGIFEDNQRTIQTISTARKLGMDQEEHTAYHRVLVTEHDGEYFGFLVDAVNDQSNNRSEGFYYLPNLTRAGLLPAMIKLGNGEYMPVLDLDVLYRMKPIKRSLALDERIDYQVVEELPEEIVAEPVVEEEQTTTAIHAEEDVGVHREPHELSESALEAEEELGVVLEPEQGDADVWARSGDESAAAAEVDQSRFFQGTYERRQGITKVQKGSFFKRAGMVLLVALLVIAGWLLVNPSAESEMVRARLWQYSSWLQDKWQDMFATSKRQPHKTEPEREEESSELAQLEGQGPVAEHHRPAPAVIEDKTAKAAEENTKARDEHVVEIELEDKTIIIEQRHRMKKPEALEENVVPGEIRHIVVEGDTLWDIAEKYLGDPFQYPELARNSQIRDPDLIYPGDVVIIRNKR